jgi:hypothetical protein
VAVDVAPLGQRVVRRFNRASPCSTVYNYVRLVVAEAALGEASAEEDSQVGCGDLSVEFVFNAQYC